MASFKRYYRENIAKQLRKYRLLANLTQEKLSTLINKNEKFIGHIERCEREISNRALIDVLLVLKIQPSLFFQFDKPFNFNEDS